jgi:hypothetical protein
LQGVLEQLEDLGATLVALTPQLPEHSVTFMDKHALNFHGRCAIPGADGTEPGHRVLFALTVIAGLLP